MAEETKKTTTKKKSTKTTAKKAVEKEAQAIAKEAAEIAEVATEARKAIVKDKPNDDRVICVVCGKSAPRATSVKVGEGEYVCSSRCLARHGVTSRKHAQF